MTGTMTEAQMRDRFAAIANKAKKLGISENDLAQLPSVRSLRISKCNTQAEVCGVLQKCLLPLLFLWITVQTFVLGVWLFEWPTTRFEVISAYFNWYDMDIGQEPCIVPVFETIQDITRPPVDCSICRGLTSVTKVSNISKTEFEVNYAYSGTPVIITDGAQNWTATDHFSFEFFKDLYAEDSPVLLMEESHCQFFPYKTNFESLVEVFQMSTERAHLKDGTDPWYIGWSNCDSAAANVLREHYDRPYFLPAVAESSKTDWIFMGSPGYGAHMHIDNVGNPSWQAQIVGTKQWTLEPPPECYYECLSRITFVVEPGQIVVLDTNIWYHSTLIVGNEMSITIGSEYD